MGNTGTSTTKNSDSSTSWKKKKQKNKKKKHKKSKSPPPPQLNHTGASQSRSLNDLHLQEQSKRTHPDNIRESQSVPSPDTTPQPQWSSMPDQYIIEHIRDLCADNNISVINIDNMARQYLLGAMRASPADKERINHIITELCKQEVRMSDDVMFDELTPHMPIHTRTHQHIFHMPIHTRNKGYGDQLSIVDKTDTSDAKESDDMMFDELTPSTYPKKQNELTIKPEYLDLRSDYLKAMQPLLKKHTRETLLEQCANDDCIGISQSNDPKKIEHVLFKYCQSVQRIDCLLSLYHKLMRSETL
eukprot:761759_1